MCQDAVWRRETRATAEAKTILLIEDDPDEREIYAALLEQRGYRVVATWNGEDGLRLAQQVSPDLIIVDVVLPSISGLTVADLLRSSRATGHIPVLLTSVADIDPDESREVGASGFLRKPLFRFTLLPAVERIIGPREGHRTERVARPGAAAGHPGSPAS